MSITPNDPPVRDPDVRAEYMRAYLKKWRAAHPGYHADYNRRWRYQTYRHKSHRPGDRFFIGPLTPAQQAHRDSCVERYRRYHS